MKKYAWIVALLAALSLTLFIGCGGDSGGGGSDPVWEYDDPPFFVLHDYLDGLGLVEGDKFMMNDAGNKSKAQFFGAMLSEAATSSNTTYYAEVIDTDGNLGLEIFTGANDWGAGVDFKQGEFEFQGGDKFVVTGKAEDAYWKFAHGADFVQSIESWATAADEEFDEELIISSTVATSIKNSVPPGVRFGNKGGAPGQNVNNGAEKTVQIYTLEIYRATNANEPFDAVEDIAGGPPASLYLTTLPYTFVGTVLPAYATEQDIVWTVKTAGSTGAAIASGELTATTVGDIVVTATVVGGGANKADFTKDFNIELKAGASPVAVTVDFSGGNVFAPGAGTLSGVTASEFTLTNKNDDKDQSYENFYAWFRVDLGDFTLADYEKVTFTFEGLTGDTGYKNLELLAQDAAFTGSYMGTRPQIQLSAPQYSTGSQAMTINIDPAKLTAVTSSEPYIVIHIRANAGSGDNLGVGGDSGPYDGDPTAIKVSNVTFVPY